MPDTDIAKDLKGIILDQSWDNFNELAKLYQKGKAISFVGSGLSIDAGIPDWKTLLTELAAIIGFQNLDFKKDTEPILAKKIKEQYEINSENFYDKIKEIFNRRNQPHLTIHRDLLDANFAFCITTNFDDLFDDAARSIGMNPFRTQCWPNFEISRLAEINVCYLHGNLYQDTNIVFTSDSYKNAYDDTEYIKRVIQSVSLENTMTFMGYSFGDIEFRKLLEEIKLLPRDDMWKKFGPHYVFFPAPSEFKYQDIATSVEHTEDIKINFDEILSPLDIKPIYYYRIGNDDDHNHRNLFESLSYLIRMTIPKSPDIQEQKDEAILR